MKTSIWNGILLVVVLTSAVGCGCGSHVDDHMSSADAQAADRIDEMAKKSGGDFDKLSKADKDYLLQVEMGSEGSARMLLKAKVGGMKAHPGPPPPATGK